MKKQYTKPSISLIQTYTEQHVMNGSVVNGQGGKEGSLGQTTGGTKSEDNTVWGDSKQYNAWSTWEE